MPKVSVLMPVFNNRLFIKESLESILSQTFNDFEFIIIDDGSSDGSAQLIKEYAKKDRRIRVLTNKDNRGIVFALNIGLQACCGEYIARMDADDISLEDRIEKQVYRMDSNRDICALGGAISYIDSSSRELGIIRHCEYRGSILSKTPLLHPTVMIRRNIIKEHNLCYIERYRFAEDYFLWLQLSRFGKIASIDDVVLKYRIHNQATKVIELKSTILATLRVKRDAIFVLKIKPNISDIFVMIMETALLFLPAKLVLFLYFKFSFNKPISVKL